MRRARARFSFLGQAEYRSGKECSGAALHQKILVERRFSHQSELKALDWDADTFIHIDRGYVGSS